MSQMHNQLGWRSAAEGQRWAKIMREVEELRAAVTAEEVEEAREALKDAKVPTSTKIWRLKEPMPATIAATAAETSGMWCLISPPTRSVCARPVVPTAYGSC
jgi:hypothetical protein